MLDKLVIMKENYTHISIILDKSGSMSSCLDATIEGLNSFLKEQKNEKGKVTVTFVMFNHRYSVVHDFVSLDKVSFLNKENYRPDGWTALLDAIGATIDTTGQALANLPEEERPSRVLVVIQTDGQENASREYLSSSEDKSARIREMIKHQSEKYNWDFVFLSAGEDAIKVACSYGISPHTTLAYTPINTQSAFQATSDYTKKYRAAKSSVSAKSMGFSDEERKKLVKKVKITT